MLQRLYPRDLMSHPSVMVFDGPGSARLADRVVEAHRNVVVERERGHSCAAKRKLAADRVTDGIQDKDKVTR